MQNDVVGMILGSVDEELKSQDGETRRSVFAFHKNGKSILIWTGLLGWDFPGWIGKDDFVSEEGA